MKRLPEASPAGRTLVATALALLAAATPAISVDTAPTPASAPRTTWAKQFVDAIMVRWPDPVSFSKKGFEYEPGIVMSGVSRVYRKTRDPRHLDYVRRWVDHFVDQNGRIEFRNGHNLDFLQPATLILFLHDETGEAKYAKAARTVRERFGEIPKNAEGGFWHKDIYPNEMWLDGIYMAEPFLVGYGHRYGDAEFCYETARFQTMLLAQRARVAAKGPLCHAWDQDRNAAWADPTTGRSPVVWSRGLGWYTMALVDMLGELPREHPAQAQFRDLLRDLAETLRRTQDPKTGMWYQVLDEGTAPDNWLETSGTGMFVYALKVAAERGLLDKEYLAVASRGWEGLQKKIRVDDQGLPVVTGAVQGMGVQSTYAAYVSRSPLENSPHGLCAILLAASEMETY